MSSRTFKEDKKTVSKLVIPSVPFNVQRERYDKMVDEIRRLERDSKKDPKIKKVLETKRLELADFVASPYCNELRVFLEKKEEARRRESVKRQAERIVATKRNSEPLELLRKQQEAKKAEEKARRLQGALARLEARKKAEAETKTSTLEDLVAELNSTIGGYGY